MTRIGSIAAAFGGMLVVGISTGTLPAAAQAPCVQWDVSGRWSIKQGSYLVDFDLKQSGTNLQGNVVQWKGGRRGHGEVGARGADGTVQGDALEITAFWENDTVGVYRGK